MNFYAKASRLEVHEASFPSRPVVTLSVVIPTYNERNNLRALIEKLCTALEGVAWEVIIVDDDSPDGTSAVAKEIARNDPRVRCLRRLDRRGLAGACVEGILSSSADLVAVMDADMQHDETILPLMDSRMNAGSDLVIGSRAADGGSAASGFGRGRAALSSLAIRCAQLALGTKVKDVMSGFFMLRRDLIEEMAPQLATSGFKILADILANAPRTLKVEEVPYHFQARVAGESKLDAKVGIDFLALMVNKASGGLIPFRFFLFASVGGLGVLIHMALLKLLLLFVPALAFQTDLVIATFVAMSSNFLVNNELTYRDARLRGVHLFLGLLLFYLVCSLGAVTNVGLASWLYQKGVVWWIAAGVGVVAASIWNFALTSSYVWPIVRRRKKKRSAIVERRTIEGPMTLTTERGAQS